MKYGSVCSGIEAASTAWAPLGWEAQWYSEIEKFPNAVLKHHYPGVTNLGDMKKIYNKKEFVNGSIDLLVGGTPCQSFSIAGLRKGLDDPRGNLALHFLKIVDRKRPRWVVWENVPGVFSSWSTEKGSVRTDYQEDATGKPVKGKTGWQTSDFDTFICGLQELGYGVFWKCFDAQYFGVPQRRDRVFVVGHLGDWRPAVAVLLESESMSGHSAPRRTPGQNVAPTISARTEGGGGLGTDFDLDGGLVETFGKEVAHAVTAAVSDRQDPSTMNYVAGALLAKGKSAASATNQDAENGNLVVLEDQGGSVMNVNDTGIVGAIRSESHGHEPILFENHPNDSRIKVSVMAPPLTARAGTGGGNLPLVAAANMPEKTLSIRMNQTSSNGIGVQEEVTGALDATSQPAVQTSKRIRRLTPLECERLQGFPDNYTLVPWRGKLATDGNRYKALGNSMPVPVMAWIGRRIEAVDKILKGVKHG